MNKKSFLFYVAAVCLLASCGGKNGAVQKVEEPLAASGRTERTENLLASLKQYASKGQYLFGHEDATIYGIGWQADTLDASTVGKRSDVKSVCGDMPAVLGFDLGHIELDYDENLDGVPFNLMRKEIINHFDHGGMVTLSWHLDNPLTNGTAWVDNPPSPEEAHSVAAILPDGELGTTFKEWLGKLAAFLNSLETPEGVRVPVVLRIWNQANGDWYWWGKSCGSAEEFKTLWRLTVDQLREFGVTNALYDYSTSGLWGDREALFMERYPGDDYVDILGIDYYCQAEEGDAKGIEDYVKNLDDDLACLSKLAAEHDKAVAITETGFENVKADNWWTQTFAPLLSRHPVSYVLIWRNAHDQSGHYFAPYPGHASAGDFVQFYNDPKTLFLKDVNGLYLKKAQ